MLYLIGLGLGDVEDIGVRGLRIARQAVRVYFEMYTAILDGPDNGIPALEKLLERSVIPADRETLEEKADDILDGADKDDVVVLVVGDPMAATTHSDLILRAKTKNIPVKIIHNSSIISAVGATGLQVYRFGIVVSIVFWTETWKPRSFAQHISQNLQRGLHTLCLLDIRVKEPDMQALIRGRRVYEAPRFMTVAQAASQLLEIVRHPDPSTDTEPPVAFTADTPCVGIARLGLQTERMVAGRLRDLAEVDLGGPLHSLIVCGQLHPLEVEFLRTFALNDFLDSVPTG
ncbi:diphthine methyl ester synthase-like [Paramacrobiotus metropolitanus]|uniref:diphthine methyl ester synthase-like n=1 Tax=Paramacrobiotus metropolitanus TaxID=2943436 RepID=UPI0024460225|nr:diphthine methyl ester synthase-like [Paramacrobiotus metropolitanus]